MRKIYLIILIVIALSCKTKQREVVKYQTEKKTEKTIDANSVYEQIVDLPENLRTFIFFDSVYVYRKPDTLSKVLKVLNFSDTQYTISEHVFNNNKRWYKLKGWNPNFKSGGYIQANKMSDFYTSYSKYDVGFLGKVVSKSNNKKSFSIKLFNTETNEIHQNYSIPNYYKYHSFTVLYESEHALEEADYIFHYKTDEDECPGRFYEEIVVSKKNELIKVWSSNDVVYDENDDALENQILTLYIPIATANKVVLAPWGQFKDILNSDLTLNTIEVDSSIAIPITNLIVLKNTKVYSKRIKKTSLKYYKWDGNGLIFIKEIFE